jgi:hypothetical protein
MREYPNADTLYSSILACKKILTVEKSMGSLVEADVGFEVQDLTRR